MKTHNVILTALLLLAFALPVSANMMEGPMDGYDSYAIGDDVRYDWNTSLFGMAITSGNTLTFIPTEFKASQTGANAPVITEETTLIKITALNPEAGLAAVNVSEIGDYFNLGEGASAAWTLGTLIDGGDAQSDSDVLTDTGSLNLWEAQTSHDVAGESVILTIQNNLIANSAGEFNASFIEKKGAHITTTVVPVPAAVWLFGSVLATLGLFRRHAK